MDLPGRGAVRVMPNERKHDDIFVTIFIFQVCSFRGINYPSV